MSGGIEELTEDTAVELAAQREFKTVAKVAQEAITAGCTVTFADTGDHTFLTLSGRGPTIEVTFDRNPNTWFRCFHNAKVDLPNAEPEVIWSMKALGARLASLEGQR